MLNSAIHLFVNSFFEFEFVFTLNEKGLSLREDCQNYPITNQPITTL